MFKWIRKQFLKGLIKDIVKALPSIKCKVEKELKENAEDLLLEVKDAIETRLKAIFKKA